MRIGIGIVVIAAGIVAAPALPSGFVALFLWAAWPGNAELLATERCL